MSNSLLPKYWVELTKLTANNAMYTICWNSIIIVGIAKNGLGSDITEYALLDCVDIPLEPITTCI